MCIYTCVYTYIHLYIYIYAYIYIYTCSSTPTYIYLHIPTVERAVSLSVVLHYIV